MMSSQRKSEDSGRGRIGRLALSAHIWVTISLALGGCSEGVLDPKGPVGAAERLIFLDAVYIMLTIVVPVVIAAPALAWWFRASNSTARYLPHWAYSGRIEFIVWSIPVLVIMFLGGITWIGSHDLDPAKPLQSDIAPLEVQVISLDWKWLFIYPDRNVASVNELVIPAGAPVHFSLTSSSVMNAFFIPQLGSMIYTMNGMKTQLHLIADKPGVFHGLSTNYSGDGFSDMAFEVRAVSTNDFNNWVSSAKRSGPVLDAAAYAQLAQQSTAAQPFSYNSVQPDLFENVLSQELPPGPGPDVEQANQTVSPRMRR